MGIELASAILFGSFMILLLLGVPIVFVLGGLAVVFIYAFMGEQSLYLVITRTFDLGTNFILLAIPLFIFMGSMLTKAGIASALYDAMYQWIGRIRGGLAIGTVSICAIFAAMVGISGAATISVGLVALPSMLQRNYDKKIAMGCISAGGALGILIPPSTVMIVIGLLADLSVGKLFLGGVFSGFLLAALFVIYIFIRAQIQPNICPPIPIEERVSLKVRLSLLKSLILPILIIISVLGSIFSGATTPTEAAAVGALASTVCTAINRRLTWQNFLEACYSSLRLSCMVMWIMFAAGCFTTLYTCVGANEMVEKMLLQMPGERWGAIVGMQIILIILGMLLDPSGIIMITSGLFFPLVIKLGFDPLWFGVLFVVNMEMAYLTPPLGFNLFYMKAIAPKGITMMDIYRSVVPFVILQLFGLVICMLFPQIILWLPAAVIK